MFPSPLHSGGVLLVLLLDRLVGVSPIWLFTITYLPTLRLIESYSSDDPMNTILIIIIIIINKSFIHMSSAFDKDQMCVFLFCAPQRVVVVSNQQTAVESFL